MTTKKEKFNIYEAITDQIIDSLNNGIIPWVKPWNGSKYDDYTCSFETPKNYITGKAYKGLNVLLLMAVTQKYNFNSPYWLTFKQCKDLGGTVRKGEKSHMVTYYSIFETELKKDGQTVMGKDGKPIMKKIPMLKYYRVFNLSQCENVKAKKNRTKKELKQATKTAMEFETIEECENVIKQFEDCPKIKHEDNEAYYVPSLDFINMPKPKAFNDNFAYYSTLFHEMSHSTGHKERLNRADLNKPNSNKKAYSFEELTSELSACFLCAETGIVNTKLMDNTKAYIQSWVKYLSDDKKAIIKASSLAQKSADYILNR